MDAKSFSRLWELNWGFGTANKDCGQSGFKNVIDLI
jgi:hypothetical protein